MVNRKESGLREMYGEKYGDILCRLFRKLKSLRNIKLSKDMVDNLIRPFKEEYEELQRQRQE
jgi:hypothetical protein